MEKPIISVIIPVYNMEHYLERCMNSIINQSFKKLEIIIVDDGSTDNSGKMCDDYTLSDDRIKVIHKENGGLGFARNSGIEIATGKYISFIDSDDYINLDMYEKLYNTLITEKADTCIYGYIRMINDNAQYIRTMPLKGTFYGKEIFRNIFLNVLGSEPIEKDDFLILWQSSCFCIFSLDIIKNNNLSFPSEREFISEDYLFITDYFIHSKRTTILNEALYYYCLNNVSLTKVFREDRFNKCVVLFLEHLRRLKNYFPEEKTYNTAIQRVQRNLLANARICIMQICKAFPYNKKSCSYISDICKNKILRNVLVEYPWKKNPLKYRIFNFALFNNKIGLLYFLASLNKLRL